VRYGRMSRTLGVRGQGNPVLGFVLRHNEGRWIAAEEVGGAVVGHPAPDVMGESRERCDGRFSQRLIP